MNRILIFIGLKIAEISAIVFIPNYLGVYVDNGNPLLHQGKFDLWGAGFVTLVVICLAMFIVFTVGYLVFLLIKDNWEWAGDISKKMENK